MYQAVRQMVRPDEPEIPDHLQDPVFVILRQKRRIRRRFTERHVERVLWHEVRRFDPSFLAEALRIHDAVIDEVRQAELAVWIRMQIIKP